MRKKTTAIMMASLLILGLTACSKPAVSDSTSETTVKQETEINSTEPASEVVEEPVKALTPFREAMDSDEKIADLLTGEWTYCPYMGNTYTGCSVTFNSDMTYSISNDEGKQTGEWSISKLFVGENESLEILRLFPYVDEASKTLSEFGGDYLFDATMLYDGNFCIKLLQANNGDSYFSMVYDEFAPLLVKETDTAFNGEPIKNSSFEGILWNLDNSNASTALLISESCDEFIVTEATYYLAADDDVLSDFPDNVENSSIWPVKVVTDGNGKITSLRFYKDYLGDAVHYVNHPEAYLEGYTLEKNDYSYNDGFVVEAYTELPIFIENNEYAVALNDKLRSIDADYRLRTVPEMETMIDEMHDALANEYYENSPYMYSPLSTYSIFWDYYGPVSICLAWDWYMGGVYNRGFECINYDPVNDRNIPIEEYMNLPIEDVRQLIKDNFESQAFELGDYRSEFDSRIDSITDFKYFVDANGIYVVFDSYELDLGTSFFEVKIMSF